MKARLVACGNMDEDKGEQDTYARVADATVIRSVRGNASFKNWKIRTKVFVKARLAKKKELGQSRLPLMDCKNLHCSGRNNQQMRLGVKVDGEEEEVR